MKCHHPDVFLAAILNAQPMGFYAPAQLVRDAREHGVEVRSVDVNRSQWDCTLEKTVTPYHAVRLGPANSIAHDFAVLPKSLHTTPLTSIAQELADLPKSVHTVPVGRGSTLLPALPAPAQQAIAAAPTPALLAARVAAHQADPATLPSHAKSVDVCARYGGHRLDFMRGHHAMWKCVYRTRRQWVASGR